MRPLPAAAGPSPGVERFQLYNACRPMPLAVEGLGDDARKIGLAEEALRAVAESRLRAARLYTEALSSRADFSTLYVNVNVLGPAFSISVEYHKWVTDEFADGGLAITWDMDGPGTHGRDAGYIVSLLSRYLDRFLAAYLRVNEGACNAAP